MADLERVYNVPLRKEWLKTPRYKRTKRAVTALRNFLKKHMKSDDIKIGKHLNEDMWKHGIKNPPHHIKVNAIKDDKNTVRVELVGRKYEDFKVEKKEEKGKLQQAISKLKGKGSKDKEEEKKEEKTEKKKEEVKKPEEKKEEAKPEPKKEENPEPAKK